jgi:hypothetical protein
MRAWLLVLLVLPMLRTARAAEARIPVAALSLNLAGSTLELGTDGVVRDRATSTAMLAIVNNRIIVNGRAMLRVDGAGTVSMRGESPKWRVIGALNGADELVDANGEKIWFDVGAAKIQASSAETKLLPLAWTGVTAKTRRTALLLYIVIDGGLSDAVGRITTESNAAMMRDELGRSRP